MNAVAYHLLPAGDMQLEAMFSYFEWDVSDFMSLYFLALPDATNSDARNE